MKFEVLTGGREEKIRRMNRKRERQKDYYFSSYMKYKYGYDGEVDKKKAVYYGIMLYSISKDVLGVRELLVCMAEYADIKTMMAFLTPRELMQMFPIDKIYDGKRYEAKDYFSTMEYLNGIDIDEPLGFDGVDDFLWEYYNCNIMNFTVNELLLIDKIRRLHGQNGILESFLKDNGITDIHSYSYDSEYGVVRDNETGETFEVINPKEAKQKKEEKYFKVIEGKA